MMQKTSLTFQAIGTTWQIDSREQLPKELLQCIHTRIEEFDHTYSRFREDSLVMQLRRSGGGVAFPGDVVRLMELYRQLYDISDGRVTPLVGSMLERAGYDAAYSFTSTKQYSLPRWEDVLAMTANTLTASQPITLDFGAAGKGYLVDIIGGMIEDAGILNYMIDASGDIRCRGNQKRMIGLEHPQDVTQIIGMVEVQDTSICASATNRRRWGAGMHHVFDPITMEPTKEILATWAVCGDALVADGLATALFFVDPPDLARHFDFQYVRIHKDMSVEYSKNFNGEVY